MLQVQILLSLLIIGRMNRVGLTVAVLKTVGRLKRRGGSSPSSSANISQGSVMVTCVAHNHKTENDFGGSNPSLARTENVEPPRGSVWLTLIYIN